MLPRKKLIPLKSEFGRIRQKGKMYDSPAFGLIVDYGKSDLAKCAFVVSKKISKSSVVRHEVKRKLADAVTPFLPRLSQSVELVFLAKQTAIKSSTDELKKEMETVFKRVKLL